MSIPKHAQVLVIGGGPAGSYTAAALAREGIDVVLMDMSKFPRYHIGESLLPSVRHYLRFIDAEDKVANFGFARKPGSAIKFNQYMREGYTDFVALGASNNAWNVVRSQFDMILLEHAESCGARVFTETKIEGIEFDHDAEHASSPPSTPASFRPWTGASASPREARSRSNSARSTSSVHVGGEDLGRPVKASYVTKDGERAEISFDYLVDASGRNGLLSTRYLKNRRYNQSLKNVAVWGYWRGAGMYGKGTARENAPFFEALSDESGWAWFIPLHNGLTSVGVVMDQKSLGIRSRAVSSATTAPLPPSPLCTSFSPSPSPSTSTSTPANAESRRHATLADKYLTFLHLAPGVQALLGEDAVLERVSDEEGDAPAARSASDFSYASEAYAGRGWRVVGDAGAFIDPFFSSGVHLAMTGAVSAAATIAASIRGDCDERAAAAYHSKRVAISYTRFLVVVLSAYKQIRAQSTNVLADIDEDNFDKAFTFFRPVIQGGADMGTTLSEDEVQRALDFCVHLFSPTTPEQHASVRRRLLASRWAFWPNEEDERGGPHQDETPEDDGCVKAAGGDGVKAAGGDSVKAAGGDGVKAAGGDGVKAAGGDSVKAAGGDSVKAAGGDSVKAAERLLDVTSPIIDPSALAKLLRTRVPSLFRRTDSSSSAGSAASSTLLPTLSSLSLSSASSSSFSSSSAPSSPVSAASGGGGMEEVAEEEEEVKMVLDKVNARRVIHAEHGEGLNSLEQEAVGGVVIRLVRGRLGLVRVDA